MPLTNKYLLLLITALSVFAGVYIYRATNLYFLADDFLHIPESINSIWLQRNSLRPVGNISLHIDYFFSNTNPVGYHITNLLLHCISTGLLFVFTKKMYQRYVAKESFYFISISTSILFFTYPFHSETIFWIIGRSGSLGTLFFLIAAIFYLLREKGVAYFLTSLISFEFALLAYESVWIFPLVVVAFFVIDKRKKIHQKLAILYPTIVVLLFATHLLVRYNITGELFNQYDANSFVQGNFKIIAINFCKLFGRTLLPPFYNQNYFIISLIGILILLSFLVIQLFIKKKYNHFFLLLSFLWIGSYTPYLSIGIDTHGTEGERYLYLPSLFFCIWLMYVLQLLFSQKIVMALVTILLCTNIFFLQQSRAYYVKASTISKSIIQQVSNLSNKEKIFIENLPQYNKGAVIFRSGLEEAMHWLYPKFKSPIIIVSIDNSDVVVKQNHNPNWQVVFEKDSVQIPVPQFLIKDKTYQKNYSKKDTSNLQFNPAKDAWLYITDSSLLITHL